MDNTISGKHFRFTLEDIFPNTNSFEDKYKQMYSDTCIGYDLNEKTLSLTFSPNSDQIYDMMRCRDMLSGGNIVHMIKGTPNPAFKLRFKMKYKNLHISHNTESDITTVTFIYKVGLFYNTLLR